MTASATRRPPRESMDAKAARLLADGRLTVARVNHDQVLALCQGDSGQVWQLGYERGRGWRCSCPARAWGRHCSHLAALMRVVERPGRA
jgi:hypothetical protein